MTVQTEPQGFNLEQALQVRVAERPADLGAKIQLANVYYDKRRHAEAVPMYLEALALDPGNLAVRTDLGTCYVALGRLPEARASFESVVLEDPNHMNAIFNLGVVEKAESNFSKAAALWERAAAMCEDPAKLKQIQLLASKAKEAAAKAAGI